MFVSSVVSFSFSEEKKSVITLKELSVISVMLNSLGQNILENKIKKFFFLTFLFY